MLQIYTLSESLSTYFSVSLPTKSDSSFTKSHMFSACKIPRTEEPCRMQSTASQRVRHAWACTLEILSIYNMGTKTLFSIK